MFFFKKKSTTTVTPTLMSKTTDQTKQQKYGPRPTSGNNKAPDHILGIPTDEHMKITERLNFCQRCCTKKNLKEQALLIATIVAVILGVSVGIALRELKCPRGKKLIYFSK